MSISAMLDDEPTTAFADGHCEGVTIYIGDEIDDGTQEQDLCMSAGAARVLARELTKAADKADRIREEDSRGAQRASLSSAVTKILRWFAF